MHHLYILATGPLLWLSLALFFGGLLVQILMLVSGTLRKERFMLFFLSVPSILRSLSHWTAPFGAQVMRREKAMTVMGFGFHTGLLALPVLLFDHVLLVYESWGVSWPTVSGLPADGLSAVVILAAAYFLVRRVSRRDMRYISTATDYLIPVLVILPFATGLWARYRLPGYAVIHIAHILSGELLLCAIPFTRLSHMIFGFFTRVYTSSEFGGTRTAKDW